MHDDLPRWVTVLPAFGPLFATASTLLVGFMVAYIAYRQWRTAKEKLVLDLFDRRFKIYTDLERSAAEFEITKGLNEDAAQRGREAFINSKFLFGKKVFAEINAFYTAFSGLQHLPEETVLYDPHRSQLIEEHNRKLLDRIIRFRLDMPNVFEKSLRMGQTN